jgi:hypothetical protein
LTTWAWRSWAGAALVGTWLDHSSPPARITLLPRFHHPHAHALHRRSVPDQKQQQIQVSC